MIFKIFKILLIILAVLFSIIISLLAYFIFVPQHTDDELFKYYFDLDKDNVEDLKVNRWSTFVDYGRDFYFKIKSKDDIEKYIEKYFVPTNKNSDRYKTSLENFINNPSVKWWKPDINSDYKLYTQNSSCFKNRITFRKLFYDKSKNVVYASFKHFSDKDPTPPSTNKLATSDKTKTDNKKN